MKNFTTVIVFAAILTFSLLLSACTKQEADVNKPIDSVVGKWQFNRIQLKLYYGGVFNKDTIIPRMTQGENFLLLEPNKNWQYRYNSRTADAGTYSFAGTDSIIAVTGSTTYRWKMLTLTDILFTAVSTSNSDPSFPGATVETYYTFYRVY